MNCTIENILNQPDNNAFIPQLGLYVTGANQGRVYMYDLVLLIIQ